jgi:hypothetical protein
MMNIRLVHNYFVLVHVLDTERASSFKRRMSLMYVTFACLRYQQYLENLKVFRQYVKHLFNLIGKMKHGFSHPGKCKY